MLGYMGNVFFCGIYGKRFFLWDIWETDFFVGYMGNGFFCGNISKHTFELPLKNLATHETNETKNVKFS